MASNQYQYSDDMDNTVVVHDLPKTPYNDRFVAEYRELANGTQIPISGVFVSGANLYQSALAILAECDLLTVAGTAKSKILLGGYNKMTCTYVVKKVEKTLDVSVRDMAKAVVDTYDKYYNSEFMWGTMLKNWRHVAEELQEGQKYDPYAFSKRDRETTLGQAGMTLLVKAFRNHLTETVRRCLNNAPIDKWDSGRASFRQGGKTLCCADFCDYVDDLLKQYWKIALFTPELTEFRAVTSAVSELAKQEKQQRRDEYAKQREEDEKRAAQEYGVVYVDNVDGSQVVQKASVPLGGHVKVYKTSGSRSGNPWNGEHGQKKQVAEKPVPKQAETAEQPNEQPQKRVISSGGQKKKPVKDEKGWKTQKKK